MNDRPIDVHITAESHADALRQIAQALIAQEGAILIAGTQPDCEAFLRLHHYLCTRVN